MIDPYAIGMGGIIVVALTPAILSHIRARREQEIAHIEETARAKTVKSLIETAMDEDFARDVIAGRETAGYRDQAEQMIRQAREKAAGRTA